MTFICPSSNEPCEPKCKDGMLDLCYRDAIEVDHTVLDRVRAEVWDEALRWVRAQADVTSPEYVIDRIDRAEPFNPYRPKVEADLIQRAADLEHERQQPWHGMSRGFPGTLP